MGITWFSSLSYRVSRSSPALMDAKRQSEKRVVGFSEITGGFLPIRWFIEGFWRLRSEEQEIQDLRMRFCDQPIFLMRWFVSLDPENQKAMKELKMLMKRLLLIIAERLSILIVQGFGCWGSSAFCLSALPFA